MALSQDSFNKKEKEKKRLKKRQDKQAKKEERKTTGGSDSMIAYVDEFGNLTDVPQDPTKKNKVALDSIEISVRKKEEGDTPAERQGRVEFYNDAKGFGFIKELDTQEKYFVHASGLEQTIKEGDLVSFELQRGVRGLNAFHVKKVVVP